MATFFNPVQGNPLTGSRGYVTGAAIGSGTGFSGTSGVNTGSRWGTQWAPGIIYDAVSGKYVDPTTGRPATGPIPGTSAFAVNGQWSATNPAAATDPGIAANRAEGRPDDFPRLYTTVQQPAVAGIAASGLAALPNQARETQGAVARFISAFNQEATTARASAPAAYNTSGTAAEVRRADRDYRADSNTVLGQIEANNREFEARQNALLQAKQNELRTYEAATNAVGDQAIAYAAQSAGARQLGLGPDVSTGNSGARSSRDAAIISGIRVPIQRELSGLRTGLFTEGMGLNREYLSNDRSTLQFQQALNETFRGNTVATAQYLQNLITQMRQLSQSEAERLLAREADNLGLGQRLRSGEITIAGMLAALEKSAIDYTYQQPFDPSRIAPTNSYPIAAPTSRYRPEGNAQDGTGANAAGWVDWNRRGTSTGGPVPETLMTPGYVPGRYNPGLGPLELGPDNQLFYTPRGEFRSVPVTGNAVLPNDYDWGGRYPTPVNSPYE